jgi:thiol-disulfide isomerase/thioredoxin
MKRIGFLLATLFISYQPLFAQNDAAFKIVPQRSHPGDQIEILYDASGTVLQGRKEVTAVVYTYENYKWMARDLKLSGNANVWKAPFSVPAQAGLIAVKFKADTLVDNNKDQGYFTMLIDKTRQGVNAPGAYAGWGLARSPKYGMDIPGYIKFKGISDSATYHWLNQEISFNQNAKSQLVYPYAWAAKNTFKADAPPRLQRVLAYLTRTDATEADLLNARKIYSNLLENKASADSIARVINQKFPKGSLARLAAFKSMPVGADLKLLLQGNEKFLADFPESATNKNFDEENRISYPVLYQNYVIMASYLNKNYAALDQYIDKLTFNVLPNVYYKVVDISFKRKEVSEQVLLPVSEKIIKRIEFLKANRPDEFSHLSPIEWQAYVDKTTSSFILPVHIHLLNTAGRYKEALVYAERAKKELGYKSATLNAELANALSHLKQDKALKSLLEKSVFENQSSPEMLTMLKSIYVKQHGSDQNYMAYLSGLQNTSGKLKMNEELQGQMFKKAMVDFEMKDLNGKAVKLADLRGKTIVFDFWATWCVPCKASFPGMKLAVEQYAKDPNVVFYFVDTEERGDTYQAEVAKYIKDNNYPFQVLFDNKMKDGKTTGEVFERICKAFSISGIPQKIVVDKEGNARFISVGYKGSATELADEISGMVELTKQAK